MQRLTLRPEEIEVNLLSKKPGFNIVAEAYHFEADMGEHEIFHSFADFKTVGKNVIITKEEFKNLIAEAYSHGFWAASSPKSAYTTDWKVDINYVSGVNKEKRKLFRKRLILREKDFIERNK